MLASAATAPQVHPISMARLFLCIWILKNPDSPQYVPHELRTIQYSSPLSTPQPTTATSWLAFGASLAYAKIPPVYYYNFSVASIPQEMGPLA